MFALATGPEPERSMLAPLVVDRETLCSDHPTPEYQQLLERAAPLLDTRTLEQIFDWIAAGPNHDPYRERVGRGGNRRRAKMRSRSTRNGGAPVVFD